MPELYGHKFKWELRKEIMELKASLNEAWARSHDYRREIRRLQLLAVGEMAKRDQAQKELAELRQKLLELARAGPEQVASRETA